MTIKLSHSAATKYSDCAKSYEYHYIKKYRAEVQSSALLFGTAIDRAAEHYATTKNFDETVEVFNKTWQTQTVNGKEEDLRFLLNFTYSDKDLDIDLLSKEDWQKIEQDTKVKTEHEGVSVEEALKEIIYTKAEIGYKELSHEDKEIFNYANWLCLKRKGRLMLKEFKKFFDSNVEEVLGCQVKIDLENENGDAVQGFIDFVFKLKGYDKPVIIDLKTAGREYEDDAVKKSPQLSLYVYAASSQFDNTRTCGFVVLNKNIQKNKKKKCSLCGKDGSGQRHKTCDAEIEGNRCGGAWVETIYPTAKTQVLIEEVSEVLAQRVIENMDEVNKAIKAEVFPRNFSNCIKYGSIKCPYYSLCHENKMEGIMEKKEE